MMRIMQIVYFLNFNDLICLSNIVELLYSSLMSLDELNAKMRRNPMLKS